MNSLLDEIIEKHNFIVRVSVDTDDPFCITVDFAGQKQAYYRVVSDEEGEIYGIAYWSSIMKPSIDPETQEEIGTEEFIPLNSIIIRLYILCDIYRQCREMELAPEIVRFYANEIDKVDFMDLLKLEFNENEIEVEQTLEICLHRILNKDIPIKELTDALEKDNLLHDFNLLRGTLI